MSGKTSFRQRPLEELPEIRLPPEFVLEPGRMIAQAWREKGPIFRTIDSLGERRLYVVGPEANRLLLVEQYSKFSNFEGWNRTDTVVETLGRGLLFLDGPEHDRLRAAVAAAFSARRIALYVPTINAIIADRINDWRGRAVIDLYEEMYKITFEIAAVILIGFERGGAVERLSALFHELMSLNIRALGDLTPNTVPASYRRSEIKKELCDLLRPIVARRRRQDGSDALSQLVKVRNTNGEGLSDDELVAHANIFLLAGHVTTSSLCAFLLHRLACDEQICDRVTTEQRALRIRPPDIAYSVLGAMETLTSVVMEAERVYPPLHAIPRAAIENVTFNGYLIPRGEVLTCSLAGTHVSDKIFRDPEVFDPTRFDRGRAEHLVTPLGLVAFAAGPRRCLGATLAEVEVKLIVAHVLGRFALDPLERHAVTLYHPVLAPFGGLNVRLSECGSR